VNYRTMKVTIFNTWCSKL